MRRFFYYLLTVAVVTALRLLPKASGREVCRLLARVAGRLRRREREQARVNLAVALPELSSAAREVLLSRVADALGRNLYTMLTLERHRSRDFAGITEDGALAAIAALQARGRGVLILTGHIGCWELLGAFLAARLGALAVVTGTVHNAPVDRLLQQQRLRLGLTPLPRQGGLKSLLRVLRRGGVVAVLLDQNTRVQNMDVPFFGQSAPTAVGFAKLALRYGVPVLPVAIGREGRGHHVRHLAPLYPDGGTDVASIHRFLVRCNEALETLIRRNLTEWVWFHKRWGDLQPTESTPAQAAGSTLVRNRT
jgi:KDO2-lipid IV(A) lauroyltransferase